MDGCSGRQRDACEHYFLALACERAPTRETATREAVSSEHRSLMKEARREVTNADLLPRGHHGEARGRNKQNKKRMIVLRMKRSEG